MGYPLCGFSLRSLRLCERSFPSFSPNRDSARKDAKNAKKSRKGELAFAIQENHVTRHRTSRTGEAVTVTGPVKPEYLIRFEVSNLPGFHATDRLTPDIGHAFLRIHKIDRA